MKGDTLQARAFAETEGNEEFFKEHAVTLMTELWPQIREWPAFPHEATPRAISWFDVHTGKMKLMDFTPLTVRHCRELVRLWFFHDVCKPMHHHRILDMLKKKREGSGRPLNDAWVVHDVLGLEAFASLSGRALIVDLAKTMRLLDGDAIWGPVDCKCLQADLDVLAELAQHSFACHGIWRRITVDPLDVIRHLPVLMDGMLNTSRIVE